MKYETIKTGFLVVLVAASVVLMWSLMTFQLFQPHSGDLIEETANKPSSEEKQESEILIPSKVIFHEKGNDLGTTNDTEISRLMKSIQTWKFYGVGDLKIYTENQIENSIETVRNLELDFPDVIPFEVYKGVIEFNDKELPNADFNKMVIDLSKELQKVTTVYFINTKNNRVYSGSVSKNNDFQDFVNNIKKNNNVYQPYVSYQLGNDQSVFLPKGEIKELSYTYYWDKNDTDTVEKYKVALFPYLKLVEKSQSGSYIEYTNGTSFMRADTKNGTLYYTNPGEKTNQLLQSKDLLKRSINFVNRNGGWTDNFRYFSMNTDKEQIGFRFFKNGLPVFSKERNTVISQKWGETQIYEYERPYINLETKLPLNEPTVKKLPNSNKVVNFLINHPKIDREKIEDITIGYTLQYDSNQKLLIYQPSWYFLYDNQWNPVMSDNKLNPLMSEDMKEEKYGLE